MAEAVRNDVAQGHHHDLHKRSVSSEESEGEDANRALEKRQGKAAAAGVAGAAALIPMSAVAGGALAVGATALVTTIILHNIHESKKKEVMKEYNSHWHSAGDAASSVGNAIATGANGQLFNPLTGNLVLVDPNTSVYYDSGTGEQVNPKTGMPFKYGGADGTSSSDARAQGPPVQQQPAPVPRLPLDGAGNISGDDPNVQQAMEQWNAMSPQQQQQLLAQYGPIADQILNSPDPQATMQAWLDQQGQQMRQGLQMQAGQQGQGGQMGQFGNSPLQGAGGYGGGSFGGTGYGMGGAQGAGGGMGAGMGAGTGAGMGAGRGARSSGYM